MRLGVRLVHGVVGVSVLFGCTWAGQCWSNARDRWYDCDEPEKYQVFNNYPSPDGVGYALIIMGVVFALGLIFPFICIVRCITIGNKACFNGCKKRVCCWRWCWCCFAQMCCVVCNCAKNAAWLQELREIIRNLEAGRNWHDDGPAEEVTTAGRNGGSVSRDQRVAPAPVVARVVPAQTVSDSSRQRRLDERERQLRLRERELELQERERRLAEREAQIMPVVTAIRVDSVKADASNLPADAATML